MDQGPRFPRVPAEAGHYESFYIKACRPGGGRGIWIRHTVHKPPGEEPSGSIWFVLFDAEAAGPVATKLTVPAAELSAPAESWIRIAGSEIGPGRARGGVATEALRASWDLTFGGEAEPCAYLPAEWLYEAPLPRTKFIAPYPDARFSGALEVGGETIALEDWPGMIGHNWGSEHAERWVWLEGTGFGDFRAAGAGHPGADGSDEPGSVRSGAAGPTYFDAGAARVRVGRWTTRWIPAGMLVLDGEPHRLGGLDQIRSSRINARPTRCDFRLSGRDAVVEGRVSAAARDFVGWVYADPKPGHGREHHTLNCSIADLELRVERRGRPTRNLRLAGGAAYEFGLRETDHGIPIQPFPDG